MSMLKTAVRSAVVERPLRGRSGLSLLSHEGPVHLGIPMKDVRVGPATRMNMIVAKRGCRRAMVPGGFEA